MAAAVSQKFEEMYKAYYAMLRHSAENIIGDHDASHDIVQEVFLKLWHKKDELDFILNQKAYLFKSVIHASVHYLEKNRKQLRMEPPDQQLSGHADSKVLLKELEAR